MTTQNPTVTVRQISEFHAQVASGRINRAMLQAFLDDPNRFVTKFPTTVNRNLGLMKLIRQAVSEKGYINQDITPERFKLEGKGAREVNLELVPFLDNETGEETAIRLETEGYTLENTAELAVFLQQYPEEVKKHKYVLAIGKDSRWMRPSPYVYVPYVYVDGAIRRFSLVFFGDQFSSDNSVLVSRQ